MLSPPPDAKVIFFVATFVKNVLQTTSSMTAANFDNISPSLFLFPYPFPPCILSNLSVSIPTWPFVSPPTKMISSFFISNNNFVKQNQNSSFSASDLSACGAYAETIFIIFSLKAILIIISLSLTFFTSTTLSTHFSAIIIPTPDVSAAHPFQKNLYLYSSLPNILLISPFHLVSCRQQKSNFLLPTISATSSLLFCHLSHIR